MVPHPGCMVDVPIAQQQHSAWSTLYQLCIASGQAEGRPFVVLLGFGSWKKWRLGLNNEFSWPLAGNADLKGTHVWPQGDSPFPWSQESWIKILITKSCWSAPRLFLLSEGLFFRHGAGFVTVDSREQQWLTPQAGLAFPVYSFQGHLSSHG